MFRWLVILLGMFVGFFLGYFLGIYDEKKWLNSLQTQRESVLPLGPPSLANTILRPEQVKSWCTPQVLLEECALDHFNQVGWHVVYEYEPPQSGRCPTIDIPYFGVTIQVTGPLPGGHGRSYFSSPYGVTGACRIDMSAMNYGFREYDK